MEDPHRVEDLLLQQGKVVLQVLGRAAESQLVDDEAPNTILDAHSVSFDSVRSSNDWRSILPVEVLGSISRNSKSPGTMYFGIRSLRKLVRLRVSSPPSATT